jgi:signal transduction histidine kinase
MTQFAPEGEALRLKYARLTRAIVHELRIPLQSLQGFAELIEPGIAPAQLERFLGFMRRDAMRLSAAVDDLGLQSELELGLVQLDVQACAVEPLLLELAQALEMRFPEQIVAVECPSPMPPALADEERLRQLLWRLLMSAARHTSSSAPEIGLAAHAAGDQVVFRVRDTGHQLPAESCELLWTPLIESASKHGRMDLGLTTWRELARCMDGDLQIEAVAEIDTAERYPAGDVFVLSLPIARQEMT